MQILGWRFKHSLCKNASVFVLLELQRRTLFRSQSCLLKSKTPAGHFNKFASTWGAQDCRLQDIHNDNWMPCTFRQTANRLQCSYFKLGIGGSKVLDGLNPISYISTIYKIYWACRHVVSIHLRDVPNHLHPFSPAATFMIVVIPGCNPDRNQKFLSAPTTYLKAPPITSFYIWWCIV